MTEKITAVLLDDEKPALDVLSYLINLYCPEIEVVGKFQFPLDAENGIKKLCPDLAFVDIRIGSEDGLDFIQRINAGTTKFIITTAHDEYILKAWSTPAVGYLLKPVDPDELVSAVNKVKALQPAGTNEPEEIIHLAKESLRASEIIAFQAAGAYTEVITYSGGNFTVSKNLKFIEKDLPSSFHRIHRSAIVNLFHIISFEKEKRLIDVAKNNTFEVSERKLSSFIEAYSKF